MKTFFILIPLLLGTPTILFSQPAQMHNNSWQTDGFTIQGIDYDIKNKIMITHTAYHSDIPLMPGWPVKVGSFPQYPVAADLNDDGYREVIIGDANGYVNILTYDGQPFTDAWPKQLGTGVSSPAVADINNDGIKEIVIVEQDNTNSYGDYWPNGRVHVLKPNGSYIAGWPFILEGSHNCTNSVSIGDINNDGTLDIITSTGRSYGGGDNDPNTIIYYNKTYAFNYDGTLLDGWPVEPDSSSGFIRQPRSPHVLVDLDDDGYLEIIIGYLNRLEPNNGTNAIYALRYDGTVKPGNFPITNETWNYALAAADMDGDDVYEIYSHGRRYDRDGNPDPTWKYQPYILTKLAFADVDQDGLPEMICASDSVHVLDVNGRELPGWPVPTIYGDIIDGNPVAGDIDGDDDIEILIGTHRTNNIYAWHHDGTPVEGFPLTTSGSNSKIALSDLDGDGNIELISACENSYIYVWEIPSKGPCTNLPWPMYQHDERHTGVLPSGWTAVEEKDKSSIPADFSLSQNYPNPFNDQTIIHYTLSQPSDVSLKIFDLRGRLVRVLKGGEETMGSHSVFWDGKDEGGRSTPSGIYIYRLDVADRMLTKKLVLQR